jgi:hypothetical protein
LCDSAIFASTIWHFFTVVYVQSFVHVLSVDTILRDLHFSELLLRKRMELIVAGRSSLSGRCQLFSEE